MFEYNSGAPLSNDTYHLSSRYIFASDTYTSLNIYLSDLNHFEIIRAKNTYEKKGVTDQCYIHKEFSL